MDHGQQIKEDGTKFESEISYKSFPPLQLASISFIQFSEIAPFL